MSYLHVLELWGCPSELSLPTPEVWLRRKAIPFISGLLEPHVNIHERLTRSKCRSKWGFLPSSAHLVYAFLLWGDGAWHIIPMEMQASLLHSRQRMLMRDSVFFKIMKAADRFCSLSGPGEIAFPIERKLLLGTFVPQSTVLLFSIMADYTHLHIHIYIYIRSEAPTKSNFGLGVSKLRSAFVSLTLIYLFYCSFYLRRFLEYYWATWRMGQGAVQWVVWEVIPGALGETRTGPAAPVKRSPC